MTAWIGWILFGLLLLWHFAGSLLSRRKRLHLRNYIVYLLLDDPVRSDHKRKFEQWIQQSNAPMRGSWDSGPGTQLRIWLSRSPKAAPRLVRTRSCGTVTRLPNFGRGAASEAKAGPTASFERRIVCTKLSRERAQ